MTQSSEPAINHGGMSPSVKSIASTVIDAPISCLAFLPKHSSFLAIGTYELQECNDNASSGQPQDRSGSIQIAEIKDESL